MEKYEITATKATFSRVPTADETSRSLRSDRIALNVRPAGASGWVVI